MKIEELKNQ